MLMRVRIQASGWHFNTSFSFRELDLTQMVKMVLRALL